MKVQEYVDMVTAADQTRENLAIFDPGAGQRRLSKFSDQLTAFNHVLAVQLGPGEPDTEAVFNQASRTAATKVLDWIEREQLLTEKAIAHYRALIG